MYIFIVNIRFVLIINFFWMKRKRNEVENVRFVEGLLLIKVKLKWLIVLCKFGFVLIEII